MKKKIIISIIAILAVFAVATTTFATNVLDELKANGDAILKEDSDPQEIPTGEKEEEQLNTGNKNEEDDKKDDGDKKEELPEKHKEAGLEDYSSLFLISVFAVSAVYAYKKLKEYNV